VYVRKVAGCYSFLVHLRMDLFISWSFEYITENLEDDVEIHRVARQELS
jgi:hypothetical protein